MKHLGSIALKGLLEDNLDFDEKELEKNTKQAIYRDLDFCQFSLEAVN